MSVISFLFYIILAFLIFHWFHEEDISGVFEHGYSVLEQIALGCLSGIATAVVIIFMASRSPVSQVLNDFYIYREISRIRFSPFDRVQLSLFAGAGEELLFRGAVQPLLGIWITSVIFVGIHGYFKFKSAGHLLFGALMFGLSMLLGLLFEHAGLISAMIAHALYDIAMLWWVDQKREQTKQKIPNPFDQSDL